MGLQIIVLTASTGAEIEAAFATMRHRMSARLSLAPIRFLITAAAIN
jgi:hypothetical protein